MSFQVQFPSQFPPNYNNHNNHNDNPNGKKAPGGDRNGMNEEDWSKLSIKERIRAMKLDAKSSSSSPENININDNINDNDNDNDNVTSSGRSSSNSKDKAHLLSVKERIQAMNNQSSPPRKSSQTTQPSFLRSNGNGSYMPLDSSFTDPPPQLQPSQQQQQHQPQQSQEQEQEQSQEQPSFTTFVQERQTQQPSFFSAFSPDSQPPPLKQTKEEQPVTVTVMVEPSPTTTAVDVATIKATATAAATYTTTSRSIARARANVTENLTQQPSPFTSFVQQRTQCMDEYNDDDDDDDDDDDGDHCAPKILFGDSSNINTTNVTTTSTTTTSTAKELRIVTPPSMSPPDVESPQKLFEPTDNNIMQVSLEDVAETSMPKEEIFNNMIMNVNINNMEERLKESDRQSTTSVSLGAIELLKARRRTKDTNSTTTNTAAAAAPVVIAVEQPTANPSFPQSTQHSYSTQSPAPATVIETSSTIEAHEYIKARRRAERAKEMKLQEDQEQQDVMEGIHSIALVEESSKSNNEVAAVYNKQTQEAHEFIKARRRKKAHANNPNPTESLSTSATTTTATTTVTTTVTTMAKEVTPDTSLASTSSSSSSQPAPSTPPAPSPPTKSGNKQQNPNSLFASSSPCKLQSSFSPSRRRALFQKITKQNNSNNNVSQSSTAPFDEQEDDNNGSNKQEKDTLQNDGSIDYDEIMGTTNPTTTTTAGTATTTGAAGHVTLQQPHPHTRGGIMYPDTTFQNPPPSPFQIDTSIINKSGDSQYRIQGEELWIGGGPPMLHRPFHGYPPSSMFPHPPSHLHQPRQGGQPYNPLLMAPPSPLSPPLLMRSSLSHEPFDPNQNQLNHYSNMNMNMHGSFSDPVLNAQKQNPSFPNAMDQSNSNNINQTKSVDSCDTTLMSNITADNILPHGQKDFKAKLRNRCGSKSVTSSCLGDDDNTMTDASLMSVDDLKHKMSLDNSLDLNQESLSCTAHIFSIMDSVCMSFGVKKSKSSSSSSSSRSNSKNKHKKNGSKGNGKQQQSSSSSSPLDHSTHSFASTFLDEKSSIMGGMGVGVSVGNMTGGGGGRGEDVHGKSGGFMMTENSPRGLRSFDTCSQSKDYLSERSKKGGKQLQPSQQQQQQQPPMKKSFYRNPSDLPSVPRI